MIRLNEMIHNVGSYRLELNPVIGDWTLWSTVHVNLYNEGFVVEIIVHLGNSVQGYDEKRKDEAMLRRPLLPELVTHLVDFKYLAKALLRGRHTFLSGASRSGLSASFFLDPWSWVLLFDRFTTFLRCRRCRRTRELPALGQSTLHDFSFDTLALRSFLLQETFQRYSFRVPSFIVTLWTAGLPAFLENLRVVVVCVDTEVNEIIFWLAVLQGSLELILFLLELSPRRGRAFRLQTLLELLQVSRSSAALDIVMGNGRSATEVERAGHAQHPLYRFLFLLRRAEIIGVGDSSSNVETVDFFRLACVSTRPTANRQAQFQSSRFRWALDFLGLFTER